MTTEIVKGLPSTHGDHYQLNTTTLIRHAARTYPEQEIVYRGLALPASEAHRRGLVDRLVPPDNLLDATLAVSLEPEGGSPTGMPSGPLVFVGKLSKVTS